jgi:hypothetical protein
MKSAHICEEDIVVFLLSTKLKGPLIIVSIPEDRRDKANPVKYKVSVRRICSLDLFFTFY